MIPWIEVHFALLFFFLGTSSAACPGNWTSYGGSCYHFSHDKEPWLSALLVCKMWDSNLVTIESAGEQFFVQRKALENQVNGYWLGGSDLDLEGTFLWQSSGHQLNFQNWDHGQPNNNHGRQNCVMMETSKHYTWGDEDCTDRNLYVCEKSMVVDPIILG